jgi:hypothetical protein
LGTAVDQTFFGDLKPEEVLYEFDRSRIFTCRSALNEILLAYTCGEDESRELLLVVPSSLAGVADLKSGACTLRDALGQQWAWFVELSVDGQVLEAHRVEVEGMPAECLPLPGTYLYPELQPLFSVKLLGDELKPGAVPASVVRLGVDQAYRALKTLVERVLRAASVAGRPEDRLRRHYDLPTQRLAFGSLEISFGEPKSPAQFPMAGLTESDFPADQSVYDEIGSLLATGSRWLESGSEFICPQERDDMQAILSAFSTLSPPSKGPVERIEIGGRLVGHGRGLISLTRMDAQRIKRARQQIPTLEESVVANGFVRELDIDRQTFILREEIEGGRDLLKGWVADELVDDAKVALMLQNKVRVTGVRTGGEQVEIQRIDPVDDESDAPLR